MDLILRTTQIIILCTGYFLEEMRLSWIGVRGKRGEQKEEEMNAHQVVTTGKLLVVVAFVVVIALSLTPAQAQLTPAAQGFFLFFIIQTEQISFHRVFICHPNRRKVNMNLAPEKSIKSCSSL